MSNHFHFNTAPAANGPALLAKLKPAYPAAALKTIQTLSAKIDKVKAERAKWLTPEARKAIATRRDKAQADPTPENLAALTLESETQLMGRYENAANDMHNVITEQKRALHAPYLELLAAVRAAVADGLVQLEEDNRTAHEAYGVQYDPATDAMLLSIRRFAENAENKLNNAGCICDPSDVLEFLGPIKSGGFFF